MIITEDFAVRPRGKGFKHLPGLWNDEQIRDLRNLQKDPQAQILFDRSDIPQEDSQAKWCSAGTQAPSAIPCPFSPDMPEEHEYRESRKS